MAKSGDKYGDNVIYGNEVMSEPSNFEPKIKSSVYDIKRKTTTCLVCNKIIPILKNTSNRRTRFCSNACECRWKYQKRKRIGDRKSQRFSPLSNFQENIKVSNPNLHKNCLTCGKEIAQLGHGRKRKYCSNKCKVRAFASKHKSELKKEPRVSDLNLKEKKYSQNQNPPCFFCGSTTWKWGFTTAGNRRYKCSNVKCSRIRIAEKTGNPRGNQQQSKAQSCIYCGGSPVWKDGHGHGKYIEQRYHCRKCGKRFPESKIPKPTSNTPNVSGRVFCSCGSSNLWKSGLSRFGKQRYQCKVCKKQFVPDENLSKARANILENPLCVYCGGHTYKHKSSNKDKQSFRCKVCHRTKTYNLPSLPFLSNIEENIKVVNKSITNTPLDLEAERIEKIKEINEIYRLKKSNETQNENKIYGENTEILTEKDIMGKGNYLRRRFANPICYKCKVHVLKHGFTKRKEQRYQCPKCKVFYVKRQKI